MDNEENGADNSGVVENLSNTENTEDSRENPVPEQNNVLKAPQGNAINEVDTESVNSLDPDSEIVALDPSSEDFASKASALSNAKTIHIDLAEDLITTLSEDFYSNTPKPIKRIIEGSEKLAREYNESCRAEMLSKFGGHLLPVAQSLEKNGLPFNSYEEAMETIKFTNSGNTNEVGSGSYEPGLDAFPNRIDREIVETTMADYDDEDIDIEDIDIEDIHHVMTEEERDYKCGFTRFKFPRRSYADFDCVTRLDTLTFPISSSSSTPGTNIRNARMKAVVNTVRVDLEAKKPMMKHEWQSALLYRCLGNGVELKKVLWNEKLFALGKGKSRKVSAVFNVPKPEWERPLTAIETQSLLQCYKEGLDNVYGVPDVNALKISFYKEPMTLKSAVEKVNVFLDTEKVKWAHNQNYLKSKWTRNQNSLKLKWFKVKNNLKNYFAK